MNIIKVSVPEEDMNDPQKVEDLCELLEAFHQRSRVELKSQSWEIVEPALRLIAATDMIESASINDAIKRALKHFDSNR